MDEDNDMITKYIHKISLQALAMYASALAFTLPTHAATNTPLDCKGVIAVKGGYKLTHDTTCTVVLNENNQFLDLNGFKLTTARLSPQGNGVTIRNGNLVMDQAWWIGDAGRLINLHISTHSTSPGFFIETASNFTVDKCNFTNIPGVALSFYFGYGGMVRNSSFTGNAKGISIQRNWSTDNPTLGVNIYNNRFISNTTGINLWNENFGGVNGNKITSNQFLNNGSGIWMEARPGMGAQFPGMQGNQFVNNQFLHNSHVGIYIKTACWQSSPTDCGGKDTLVAGNYFIHNGYTVSADFPDIDDGMKALGRWMENGDSSPSALVGVKVSNNRASLNADLGLDVDGVTDGGGNKANRNRDPTQCLGVYCASTLSATTRRSEKDRNETVIPLGIPQLRHTPR